MRSHEFGTITASKARPASAMPALVAETAIPERGLRPHVDLAGGRSPAQHLAAVLRLPGSGHLADVGPVLFQLQHRYGNRSVQRVIGDARRVAHPSGAPVIQPKLTLDPGHDKYEREAERVAQQVVDHATLSGTAAPGDALSQRPAIQRLDNSVCGDVDPDVQHAITRVRGGGQAIPDFVRAPLEWALGADFSDVRLHAGVRADELNRALRARAFTTGQDIFLRRGEFSLTSRSGQRLLAHELAHVLQQGGGRQMPAAGSLVTVQCSLRDAKGNAVTWAQLSGYSSVTNAAQAVRKVIEWWADAPSSPKVKYKSLKDLTTRAGDQVEDPPTAFIDWLDHDGLDALLTYFIRNKLEFSPEQTAAIKERREVLAQAAVAVYGPSPRLHSPKHDPKYGPPERSSTTALAETGRGAGKFKQVPVPDTVSGLPGKTTGSANLALVKEQIARENWKKVGGIHVQICPGCGGSQNVAIYEVDHQQALSEIRDTLLQMADAMSINAEFYDQIQKTTPAFADYFQVHTEKSQRKVTATQAALSHFSNDLGNLMRLCRICNGATDKSDINFLEWYRGNKFFGQDFLTENLSSKADGWILARTKHDTGWGQAALDWFYKYHFPILKDGFILSRLGELVRGNLAQQSQLEMRARFESDITKKRKYEEEVSGLSKFNEAFVGSGRVIADYMEEGPAPFAPGSPQRLTGDIGDYFQEREKRKRREKNEATESFAVGWVAANEGSLYDDSGYDTRLYAAGYTHGRKHVEEQYGQGYVEALADPVPDYHPLSDTVYAGAFSEVFGHRRSSFQAGFSDGRTGSVPDPTVIPRGIRGEANFLRDYMIGYGKGMTFR